MGRGHLALLPIFVLALRTHATLLLLGFSVSAEATPPVTTPPVSNSYVDPKTGERTVIKRGFDERGWVTEDITSYNPTTQTYTQTKNSYNPQVVAPGVSGPTATTSPFDPERPTGWITVNPAPPPPTPAAAAPVENLPTHPQAEIAEYLGKEASPDSPQTESPLVDEDIPLPVKKKPDEPNPCEDAKSLTQCDEDKVKACAKFAASHYSEAVAIAEKVRLKGVMALNQMNNLSAQMQKRYDAVELSEGQKKQAMRSQQSAVGAQACAEYANLSSHYFDVAAHVAQLPPAKPDAQAMYCSRQKVKDFRKFSKESAEKAVFCAETARESQGTSAVAAKNSKNLLSSIGRSVGSAANKVGQAVSTVGGNVGNTLAKQSAAAATSRAPTIIRGGRDRAIEMIDTRPPPQNLASNSRPA